MDYSKQTTYSSSEAFLRRLRDLRFFPEDFLAALRLERRRFGAFLAALRRERRRFGAFLAARRLFGAMVVYWREKNKEIMNELFCCTKKWQLIDLCFNTLGQNYDY